MAWASRLTASPALHPSHICRSCLYVLPREALEFCTGSWYLFSLPGALVGFGWVGGRTEHCGRERLQANESTDAIFMDFVVDALMTVVLISQ